jgi:hypothetical protein
VWVTLLVMAVAVSLEPFRIGMTVLMLNRPRPILQLVAFLGGGFAMGTTVGLVVLLVLRPALLRSTHVTLPTTQIVIGVLALLVAAVLATGLKPPGATKTKEPGRLSVLARRLATGSSPWVAAVAGLGIALPSVDYLAALAVILASHAPAGTQVVAVLMFNVVAFALVEIPLVAYLIAPERTRATMDRLHGWIRSRRRRDVAALLAGIGALLVVVGLAGV